MQMGISLTLLLIHHQVSLGTLKVMVIIRALDAMGEQGINQRKDTQLSDKKRRVRFHSPFFVRLLLPCSQKQVHEYPYQNVYILIRTRCLYLYNVTLTSLQRT